MYRWLIVRWGDTLFPNGDHDVKDVTNIANSGFDRRMDEIRYWDLPVIMEKLEGGIGLVQRALSERDVAFLRRHTYVMNQSAQWKIMAKAHPSGITPGDEPGKAMMTLEACIRHVYFEEITHLFNIQRLKRAQALEAVSELPPVGYWSLDEWDTSEPYSKQHP